VAEILVAVNNPVTATPVKRTVFSTTGQLMNPTEWMSSYSASDSVWLILRVPTVGFLTLVDGKYLISEMALK
jgi:hypothetical protein